MFRDVAAKFVALCLAFPMKWLKSKSLSKNAELSIFNKRKKKQYQDYKCYQISGNLISIFFFGSINLPNKKERKQNKLDK